MTPPVEDQEYIVVARVGRPRGTAGWFLVEVMTDSPGRFDPGEFLHHQGQRYLVEGSYQLRPGINVLKLEGVDTRDHADAMRDKDLTIPIDQVPTLPEGEFYHFQLIGMRVFTVEGADLGSITKIMPTGSNDVYIVSHEDKEVLIPAVEGVVQEVDVDGSRMTVDLPEGLR